jgi:4-hydroxy-tetrahydrodipicolinate synthase
MFTGCGTAMVTPFHGDGSLDEPTLRNLIQRQIDAGIDFLVPCGTTGESPTLTPQEHLRVVEITVELAQGRVPVLAGAGGYNTSEVIVLARELAAIGADGLLSVTPYYNKPTQEGLFQHYRAIANAASLPMILYSVQGRTGVNIEPATVKRLAGIENIVGIKEASGNIGQMAAILNIVPDDFVVLSGDDAITLPLIALGGRGVISVVSNEIPAQMTQLVHLAMQGNISGAREIHRRFHSLMDVNFVESNPIPVKAAMADMGLLEPVWRLPLVAPGAEHLARVREVLASLGLAERVHAAVAHLAAVRRTARRVQRRTLPAIWRIQERAESRRGARGRARSRFKNRLARERLGEEGNPARLSDGLHRGHVCRQGGKRIDERRTAAAVHGQGYVPVARDRRW